MQIRIINVFHLYGTEPVGAKAPTFSSDSKGSIFVRQEGTSFAMLCQAQAFPVPLIRYVCTMLCDPFVAVYHGFSVHITNQ